MVFPAGFTGRDGEPLPIIVRKRDGGYGYGATDLAAIRHRTKELRATRLLYVVGRPQRQHLAMVFQTAREAGWLAPPASAPHVGFGQVLGADGRKFASRAGRAVKLADVLDEAVAGPRHRGRRRTRSSTVDQAAVAQAVGIGAVKYADLSTDRIKDYVFDWDRMLAPERRHRGLPAVHARPDQVDLPAGRRHARPRRGAIAIADRAERALALELLAFPAVIKEVEETLGSTSSRVYL